MRHFKKILFLATGAAGEKTALTRSFELAAANHARIAVMGVIDDFSFESADPSTVNTMVSMRHRLEQNRARELDSLIGKAADTFPSVKAATEVRFGKDFVEVIRAVLEDGHDLVIKAKQGSMGTLQRMFGSTDLKLMRKCPCPVWIIKPERRRRYARILAAVDPDPFRPESVSLNRTILDLAVTMAESEQAELHVVHAWHLMDEAMLKEGQVPRSELIKINQEMEQAHQHQMQELLSHYRAHKHVLHIIKGPADKIILRLVKQKDIDLLVMGTVARSGISGLLIGNTAERILDRVNCSVLTVKPEGFAPPG